MASRPLRFGFGKPEVSKSQICPALCLLSRVFFSGSRVSGNHVGHSNLFKRPTDWFVQLGFEFGPQWIRNLAYVCPQSVLRAYCPNMHIMCFSLWYSMRLKASQNRNRTFKLNDFTRYVWQWLAKTWYWGFKICKVNVYLFKRPTDWFVQETC